MKKVTSEFGTSIYTVKQAEALIALDRVSCASAAMHRLSDPVYDAYIQRLAGHIRETLSDDNHLAYQSAVAVTTAAPSEVDDAMEYNYSHPLPAKVCGNQFCGNGKEYPSTYVICPYCDEVMEECDASAS